MKKRANIFLVFILLTTIFLINSSLAVSDPGDVSGVLGEQFGINPDDIPTDPTEIEHRYLKQEWTEIISNSSVLGPIHRAFEKNTSIFKILFAHPYEVSLTLIGILILWFFFLFQVSKIIEGQGMLKGWQALIASLAFSVILAQVKLFEMITTTLLDIIFKQENWWIRSIITIAIFAGLAVLYVLSRMASKKLKEQNKEKTEQKINQRLKDLGALTSGIKEAK